MKRRKMGRPRVRPLGKFRQVNVHMTNQEAAVVYQAAKRAKMSASTWVRNIVLPVALNALADLAAKSTVLDTIRQEVKVAEGTFDIS